MAIPAAFSKEVGAGPLKLPLWGWAIAGVGGVFVARKITGGKGAAAASSTSDPAAPADTSATDLPAGGVLTLGANGALNVPGGALSPVANGITDNDQWRTAAINALITRTPPYDALFAASTVQKYLDGDALTTAEQGAISWALTRIGPTPTPVPPSIPIVTPPAPTPGKPIVAPGPITIGQQSTPNTPKPALPANHAAGEAFVDFANPPFGKGTWWLTNWGGVYAVGGAPYKGNPIRSRVAKALGAGPAGQTFVSIEPFGTGYRIHDNRADTGDYVFQ